MLETQLLQEGICDEAYLAELNEEIKQEVSEAFEKAKECPFADPEVLYAPEMIYASPETGGEI